MLDGRAPEYFGVDFKLGRTEQKICSELYVFLSLAEVVSLPIDDVYSHDGIG